MLSSYTRTCREDFWPIVPELEDESTLHRERARGRGNCGVRPLRRSHHDIVSLNVRPELLVREVL